jgi:hypothetical protein
MYEWPTIQELRDFALHYAVSEDLDRQMSATGMIRQLVGSPLPFRCAGAQLIVG